MRRGMQQMEREAQLNARIESRRAAEDTEADDEEEEMLGVGMEESADARAEGVGEAGGEGGADDGVASEPQSAVPLA